MLYNILKDLLLYNWKSEVGSRKPEVIIQICVNFKAWLDF